MAVKNEFYLIRKNRIKSKQKMKLAKQAKFFLKLQQIFY